MQSRATVRGEFIDLEQTVDNLDLENRATIYIAMGNNAAVARKAAEYLGAAEARRAKARASLRTRADLVEDPKTIRKGILIRVFKRWKVRAANLKP